MFEFEEIQMSMFGKIWIFTAPKEPEITFTLGEIEFSLVQKDR
jgi:hypothetical protein